MCDGSGDLVLSSPLGPVPYERGRWCEARQEAGDQVAEFRDGQGLREPRDQAAAV